MNDVLIDGSNTNTVIGVGNTDNNTINAETSDNIAPDTNAATDGEKSDDVVMSNDNTDNTTMSNNNTDDATTGDGNTVNTTTGETSMVEIPSPLCYGRKTKDPSKVKSSKRHIPIMVEPSDPSIGDPSPDEFTTVTVSGHAFDPMDVHIYQFFIQGAPNLPDLEGVEEDQLLEIQRTIQDKLKQRDEERERNITKRMKQYEEKYGFSPIRKCSTDNRNDQN